ncbi:hypothetical protein ACIA8O_31555 [Kitasatospora sp. NPDC051853]|uniref:hypothetical protein n=1 Tax=Kitasatospora sp. NPDC051853 TaxID=3364058 RepID=UPI00379D480A
MRAPRGATRLLAVPLLAAALTVTAGGCARPSGTPDGPPPGAAAASVILDADEHGALVLDGVRQELRGVTADGRVLWRDREMAARPYVSCLRRCPDAVASGPSDGQPPAPSVLWRTGSGLRTEPGRADLVLWADSPQDALVLRPTTGGAYRLDLPADAPGPAAGLEGSDPQLFPAADGRRAVLVFRSPGTHYRSLERGASGWTASAPVPAEAVNACTDEDGTRTVLFGDGSSTSLVRATAPAPQPLPVPRAGACLLAGPDLLTQRFTGDGEHGTRTTTSLYTLTGELRWQRTDPGDHLARRDPSTGLIVLPTDTALLLLHPDGTPAGTAPTAADAYPLPSGPLLVLTPDGTLHRRPLR